MRGSVTEILLFGVCLCVCVCVGVRYMLVLSLFFFFFWPLSDLLLCQVTSKFFSLQAKLKDTAHTAVLCSCPVLLLCCHPVFIFIFPFETRSQCVVQVGLELIIYPRLSQIHGSPSTSASLLLALQSCTAISFLFLYLRDSNLHCRFGWL